MATMATSHGLTVIAHSCIKPPVDPKTGLSATLHERARTYHGYIAADLGDGFDAGGGSEYPNGDDSPPVHVSKNPAIDVVSEQLSNLQDEEFYDKLCSLKNEHKKTLQVYEQLYKQKVLGYSGPANGLPKTKSGKVPNSTQVSLNGYVDIHSPDTMEDKESPLRRSLHEEQSLRGKTSSKPPTGRPFKPSYTAPVPRPSSAPVYRRRGSLTRSLEEEVWAKLAMERNLTGESGETQENIQNLRESMETYENEPPELASAMSRIEDMWENFSVEDYAPRSHHRERPSSASVTRHEREKTEKEWRHRITIPKPFKMTLREESKERTKTKAQIENEEKIRRQQIEEEEECQKKFKAQPVPAHVYLPLYDEINEKNEARRRYIKECSEELLKSQEKPFHFITREAAKKEHTRVCSAPEMRSKSKSTFKAKGVPSYIFDTSIDTQIQEEEEYRKIRIKMRAEELLRKASLPDNMEARERAKALKAKDKAMKSKKKGQSKNRVNHEVPDYDELYRHFQQELIRRKHEREATVVKPFKLSSARSASKEQILRDMEKDEETLKENRWPYMTPRTTPRKSLGFLSSSLDSLPASSTKAADLRNNQIKRGAQKMKESEKKEIDQDRRRRVREMRLRQSITDRVGEETSQEEMRLRKLRQHREAERDRLEQYEKELEEIRSRVEKRPLLVEKQSQVNAKNAINKKFSATLKNVGLDEDFVQSRSSRAASVHDDTGDDYEDDFDKDVTYSKSKDDDDDYDDDTLEKEA